MNVRPNSAVTDKRKAVDRSKDHRRRENHNRHLSKPSLTSQTGRTLADFWPPISGRSVTHAFGCSEPYCHKLKCRAEESSEQFPVVDTAAIVPVVQRILLFDVAAAEVAAAQQTDFMALSVQRFYEALCPSGASITYLPVQ